MPQSSTTQLICSASKGNQSSKHCFAWATFGGIQLQESTKNQKNCLGQPLEEGT